MTRQGGEGLRLGEDDEVPPPSPICLAFSGAGLHGFYFNGVCQYIYEQGLPVQEAWGASAGALAALSALMSVGAEAYESVFSNYDRNYLHLPWMFWHGRDFVWDGPDGGIRRFMPKGRKKEAEWLANVVNGRLHIVVSKIAGLRLERVVVSHWDSVEDLIGCVRATMTIPGITATRPFRWRGASWIDGGFVDQHPSTEKAVLVSTSMPFQPWAHSWQRHVDIFRHLPIRMSWWHGGVSGRRDMFSLGYMDAKTYFEVEVEERRKAKPLRPKVRAARFLMNLVLELLQGSFMMALTARFVWRRKALWSSIARCRWASTLALWPPAQLGPGPGRWLMRVGLLAEIASISAASFLLWCTAIDLRLDLSDHLLDLAGLGKKRPLPRSSSQLRLKDSPTEPRHRETERAAVRRARSQPSRARRA